MNDLRVIDDDFMSVEANDCPMSSCAARAGSPCRTGRGKVAVQYHTARFRLVPALAKALSVPVPPVRSPGSSWTELPRPAAAGAAPAGHVRIGYARASTVRQSLDTQADSLRTAGVTRVFAEKISTRAVTRPELDKAVALAREIRASGAAVTIVVHEHKRLGRGIELAALAEQLRAGGIGLEFLTGELQGSHDPSGIVFTVLAALSGMERECIRDRTLEGHESARARGKAIGGAAVTDEAMLAVALHLRGQGTPPPVSACPCCTLSGPGRSRRVPSLGCRRDPRCLERGKRWLLAFPPARHHTGRHRPSTHLPGRRQPPCRAVPRVDHGPPFWR